MSWGGIPFYIYAIQSERNEAKMLGGFAEEVNAGWVRSTPDHWADYDRYNKWNAPLSKQWIVCSLGVDVFDSNNPKRVYFDIDYS